MQNALVVEDDDGIRQLLVALLREYGFDEVLTASSTVVAVEFASTYALDLVVLDHRLPGESGIELAERLRKLPGFNAAVLVTTALPTREAEKVCAQAKACECVPKPFEIADFLDAVKACMDGRKSSVAA